MYQRSALVGIRSFPEEPDQFQVHPGRPARSAAKRLLDVSLALMVLTIGLPLLLLIALLIRLDSPGPALFRQTRGGLGGQPFMIYKFRTMRVLEDQGPVTQAQRGDPRITKLGAFLRRTSLDEVPQILNVLKGDMSIVGPRPHAIGHDTQYRALLFSYTRRMAVKPGLTGMAQVRGFRGETRNLDAMAQRIHWDLAYIDRWSLALDLQLIAATVIRVPFDADAY